MGSVELAIYTPVLFITVFVIVQAALVWHANQAASAVARDIARVARADGGSRDPAELEAWGVQRASKISGNGLNNVDVDVEFTVDEVHVTVTGRSLEVVTGVSPEVEQTVQGPIEEFKPDL